MTPLRLKNQLPPTDTTGYTLWLRPTKIFVKAHDTGFQNLYQSVIVYPKPGIIKVYNFAITPTSYGGVVSSLVVPVANMKQLI